jgi:hypothetical protein
VIFIKTKSTRFVQIPIDASREAHGLSMRSLSSGFRARVRYGRETEGRWLRAPDPGGGGTDQPNNTNVYLFLIDRDHMS